LEKKKKDSFPWVNLFLKECFAQLIANRMVGLGPSCHEWPHLWPIAQSNLGQQHKLTIFLGNLNNQTIPPKNLGQPFLIWWKIDPFLQAIIWITHEPTSSLLQVLLFGLILMEEHNLFKFGWWMDLMLV
jgi:hypothetical protein